MLTYLPHYPPTYLYTYLVSYLPTYLPTYQIQEKGLIDAARAGFSTRVMASVQNQEVGVVYPAPSPTSQQYTNDYFPASNIFPGPHTVVATNQTTYTASTTHQPNLACTEETESRNGTRRRRLNNRRMNLPR